MKVMRGDEILPLHIVDNIPSTLRADFIEYYAKAVHERSYESLWEAVYSHTSENWAEDRERLSQLDDIRRTLGMEVKYPETMETEA